VRDPAALGLVPLALPFAAAIAGPTAYRLVGLDRGGDGIELLPFRRVLDAALEGVSAHQLGVQHIGLGLPGPG
jgi:hypothetical protein